MLNPTDPIVRHVRATHRTQRPQSLAALMKCVLLALPFACMAEESAEPAMPVFEWERNPAGHWRMLENGEKAVRDVINLWKN